MDKGCIKREDVRPVVGYERRRQHPLAIRCDEGEQNNEERERSVCMRRERDGQEWVLEPERLRGGEKSSPMAGEPSDSNN